MEENRNITRGLTFRDMSSGDKSKKDKESIEVERAETGSMGMVVTTGIKVC